MKHKVDTQNRIHFQFHLNGFFMKEKNNKLKNVFILEDDQDIRLATTFALNKTKEFSVISSSTTTDAAFKIMNQKFDCIILDYQIGLTETSEKLIEYIKMNCHFNKTTPIILTIGSLDKKIILKLKDNITSAIVKPVARYDLIERIKKLTSQ